MSVYFIDFMKPPKCRCIYLEVVFIYSFILKDDLMI